MRLALTTINYKAPTHFIITVSLKEKVANKYQMLYYMKVMDPVSVLQFDFDFCKELMIPALLSVLKYLL